MDGIDLEDRIADSTTRRTVVKTGVKLAYVTPIVAASFTLRDANAQAPISPGNQPCEAFVCGNPLCVERGPDILDRCACFELTEDPGNGLCLGDFPCDGVSTCNTTADCPSGSTCVTNTCCGLGVQLCAPACPDPTDSRSRRPPDKSSGPTATGR
jgi:hypothetical protein